MGHEVSAIARVCDRLRQTRAAVLAPMSQRQMVEIIAGWATEWRRPESRFRKVAAALTEPFPFAMMEFSLDALLRSLTPDALWDLIEREGVRDAVGPPLLGHVVAGNTPLLAWVSLLRGLLLRSAGFVKLPSGPAAEWGRLFVRTLAEIAPPLAACVHLAQWPGGTSERDAALCRNVDLLVAYGADSTLEALRGLCPPSVGFVGYGHRVSFGLLTRAAHRESAAVGFARDVLLYDQGGCLSPQTIFVEGAVAEARAFAGLLADALAAVTAEYPPLSRTPAAALCVREARWLARMDTETVLWEDDALRWTVIARPQPVFVPSPTHGVISAQPLADLAALPPAVQPVRRHLQGCALAAPEGKHGPSSWSQELERLGVSRLCPPGELQRPPFSWREDSRDVLRSLLSAGRVEDDQLRGRRQCFSGE